MLDIPAQPVASALTDLGLQTGLTIIIETKVSLGVKSEAVHGSYTADEALKKLLEPVRLRADYLDSKTVAIRIAKEDENMTLLMPGAGVSSLHLASEADQSGPAQPAIVPTAPRPGPLKAS